MASFGAVIDFLLMLSIGGLAGLVIALHLKLRQFSAEASKVPALADDLTRAITASRSTMQALANAAKTDGARLEELLSQAERARQEMVYVLDRAEQVLAQFDSRLEEQPAPQPRRLNSHNGAPQPNSLEASPQQRLHGVQQPGPQQQTPPAPEQSRPQPASQNGAETHAGREGGTRAQNKAAIMPGRYQARLGVDQNGRPRPYKPASFQSGAAAYGASAQNQSTESSSATEAESELRRALENAI